ncbi:CBS domain-containing protein [Desulfallas sp. Bu1-1]|uniref:CBS and ACT domain-containing protein n=1 Tax=Desulfallas sp. Bu1-1 TaxID=2787620 RepID=UPI0018A0474A|nr:CBS and ACT domain-containing protein [Desulfallas sp. Bu1-1]MBF7082343.1 CBS domain-containing protein [Desulfallas sp. Bu1-1]
MFVKDYMSTSPITIPVDTPVLEALNTMRKRKIHQLPVMNRGKLAGLITELELLTVTPSPASTLSVFEMNYLLSKMTVKDVLVKEPVTVEPSCTIEEAALKMREHGIRCLLVVEDDQLKGIITQTDVFDALIRIFGLHKAGVRLVLEMENKVGALADVLQVVKEYGLNVLGVACREKEDNTVQVMLRLRAAGVDDLINDLTARGIRVLYSN